jgi:hypothetical protein
MEPCGFVLSGPKDLELEEGTALPLQLNPFGQLISAHVLHIHLEGEAIGQLAPFLYRVSERLDELSVLRPFLRRNSVDVAESSST